MAGHLDDRNLNDVHITRGTLDSVILVLRRIDGGLSALRQLELDVRMLRGQLEAIRNDLEPITRRATPYPLETTVVRLPDDWPDKPRG